MSRDELLQGLLKNRHIWRPGDLCAGNRRFLPSGFEALDRHLGGGWPVGSLTEVLLDGPGIGELRLLMPALLRRSHADRHGQIAWITPPYIPYAPALAQQGLDVTRMVIVHPEKQADRLWAMEQALRSASCVAVLGWLADVNERTIRRLQLASEAGSCWAVVFRHTRFVASASSAPLRIHMLPRGSSDCIDLHVLRNRYGSPGVVSVQC